MMNTMLLHIATRRSGTMLFMPKAVSTNVEATQPIASKVLMVIYGHPCRPRNDWIFPPSSASIDLQRAQVHGLGLAAFAAVVEIAHADHGQESERCVESSHAAPPLRIGDAI
jgi:hypothetical protein